MGLRRGFKTEANLHSKGLRLELKLKPHAPMCPWSLADHLHVPVVALSELKVHAPGPVRLLMSQKGQGSFSAVTVFSGRHGRRRTVLHNDSHHESRQAANLAHELAHAILCHRPTPPFEPDPVAEEEALWLGPALLISDEAALHIVEQAMTVEAAADFYGVSVPLVQMRLNVTGAYQRVARRRRKRGE